MTQLSNTAAEPPADREPKKQRRDRTHWLYILVIVGVITSVVVGLVTPAGSSLGVLGTLFVNLIKMMISPVIFCTIVLGIGSVRKAASVGKVGGLAMAYSLVMSTVALAIGLLVGNLIKPGTGLNIPHGSGAGAKRAEQAHSGGGTMEFFENIIPTTLLSSLTVGNVLQTLFVALLVGFGIQAMGPSGEPFVRGVRLIQTLIFRVLSGILWLAPIGAFGAMAKVVGDTGFDAVDPVGRADVGLLFDLHHFRVRRAGGAAAGGCWDVDLQAGALPGPRVPADRRDVVVGIGAAPADRQTRARRCAADDRGHRRADRLFVHPGWHRDLPDHGVAVHRRCDG